MISLACNAKSVFNSFLCVSSLFGTQAIADSLPEVQDFRIKAKAAKTAQVPILVLFMSDTYHFCEIVLDDFLLPMQRDSATHKVWGLPQEFLFDSNGKVLTTLVGLLTVDFYYAYLDDAINNSLAKIRGTAK